MAVALVATSVSGTSDTQSTTKNIPVPTGAASGHIALVALEMWLDNGVNPTVTYPSGFTEIVNSATSDNFQKLKVAWKRLTAADTGNYTLSWSGSQWNMGHCVLISGAIASGDPTDFVNTVVQNTASTTVSSTSGTATGADFLAHFTANENQATTAPPTGYTEDQDPSAYIHTNHKIGSGAGTETASGGTLSASTRHVVSLIAIKPATGGATDLVIQDASIPTSSDNVVLTQVHSLAVADATLGTSSDNVTLTQFIDLAIQKAVMAMTADVPNLSQVHQIVINDAFLQTSADIVNMAGQSGGPMSVADLQAQKLPALTGKTGSVEDLLHEYYGGLSGLAPVAAFSTSDHQRAYYATQTGLNKAVYSFHDLEKAFYDQLLVPSGSLADRTFVYWTGL